MDGTIAEIRMFAGNFPPSSWAFCDGSLQSIAQNTALFSLVGTTYGGDGQNTFALPDLRCRVSVGQGTGPGLPNIDLGELAGQSNVTLTAASIPAHSHAVQVNDNITGMSTTAANNFQNSKTESSETVAAAGLSAAATLSPATIGVTGGNQPFNNVQPYLGMNYIICLFGIYPSRN